MDWATLKEAEDELLVNALAMLCPFAPEEKQALLEARVYAQSRERESDPAKHAQAVAERTGAATELCATLRRIARREIKAYDQLCQFQSRAPNA